MQKFLTLPSPAEATAEKQQVMAEIDALAGSECVEMYRLQDRRSTLELAEQFRWRPTNLDGLEGDPLRKELTRALEEMGTDQRRGMCLRRILDAVITRDGRNSWGSERWVILSQAKRWADAVADGQSRVPRATGSTGEDWFAACG